MRDPRETSLLAWEQLVASGKISKRRALALRLMILYGPGTAGEICANSTIPGLWKRMSELERMGYAIEVAVRPCRITGYQSIVWQAKLAFQQAEMF